MVNRQKLLSGISRRELLKRGLGSLAVGLSGSLCLEGCRKRRYRKNIKPAIVKGKKPNVLLISVDTLRADHVSCYGYKEGLTPNIDTLALHGHRFRNAYTTMPSTLPAHASLFSSLYPIQLSSQRNGEKISTKVTTITEILRSKGYHTAAFVGAHVLNSRYGINQGFQTYDNVEKENIMRPAKRTVKRSIEWLASQRDAPFFLFVHLFDPHTPYYVPPASQKNAQTLPPDFGFLSNPTQFTPELVREIIDAYDDQIAYVDWAIGKLLDALNEYNLIENTIIVIVSDHGESLDELITRYGYAFDHGDFLHIHQLRIPLIIQLPGGKNSQQQLTHNTPVSIVDVMPTILELLQIKPPDPIVGVSLLPILRGEKISHGPVFSQRQAFEEAPKPYLAGNDYSIIEGNWHLITSTVRDSELYNLRDDHREISNLLQETEISKTLKNKIARWLQQNKPLFGPPVFEADKEALEQLRSLGYAH